MPWGWLHVTGHEHAPCVRDVVSPANAESPGRSGCCVICPLKSRLNRWVRDVLWGSAGRPRSDERGRRSCQSATVPEDSTAQRVGTSKERTQRRWGELRAWHKINVSISRSRGDGVIPLTVECVPAE